MSRTLKELSPSEHILRFILKLKLFRELANLSQIQIAEAVGVSHRTYQRIEAGESGLDLELVLKICAELKVDFYQWLNLKSPEKLDIVSVLDHISDNELTEDELKVKEIFMNQLDQQNISSFTSCHIFRNNPSIMFFSMNTRKFANDIASSMAKIEPSSKITAGYSEPQVIIDYLDWLHIHKPVYTKIDPVLLPMKNGLSYFTLNYHHYKDGDVYILSIFRESN